MDYQNTKIYSNDNDTFGNIISTIDINFKYSLSNTLADIDSNPYAPSTMCINGTNQSLKKRKYTRSIKNQCKDEVSIESIKVKVPGGVVKCKQYIITSEHLSQPQSIVCKLLKVNSSTFSRAFKNAISLIPSLSKLVRPEKKKNLWPYRNRFSSPIIHHAVHHAPIIVSVRNYTKSKSFYL